MGGCRLGAKPIRSLHLPKNRATGFCQGAPCPAPNARAAITEMAALGGLGSGGIQGLYQGVTLTLLNCEVFRVPLLPLAVTRPM